MNTNHNVRWIAIIVSILIASAGISYGVIQSATGGQIEIFENRIDKHEEMIIEMKTQGAVIENELKHINEKIDEINNKLGKITGCKE